MKQRVTKAVIPAAGMGTRFFPATKSMPKEMLPIVDKPVVQYVIEEAIASGITDILLITGRSKRSIENHFDANPGLEAFLSSAGKEEMISDVRDIAEEAQIHYIRQKSQLGLGDAIRHAKQHVGDHPFAVLLGDTIIDSAPEGNPIDSPPGLKELLDVYETKQASVVAVHEVPENWVSRYGIVDGDADPELDNLFRLNRLVEKPAPADAPSRLAIAGRYVFSPQIFDFLETTEKGVGGEIQLTDAMNALAQEAPMFAYAWNARRYDIGNRSEYAKCFIDYALRRPDTGPSVRAYLEERLQKNR